MTYPVIMVMFYWALIGVSMTAFVAATFYLNRRVFLFLSAVPLLMYGVGFYAFPGLMLTLSVVSGNPGPEHLVAYNHQGKAFLETVALFYFLRNSEDDRVTGWGLTQIAQTCLAQVMALASFHYSQLYKLEHGDRPAVILNTDVNSVLYIGMGLWFIITMVQFLRRPQLKPMAADCYDNRMTVHRAVLYSSSLLVGLLMIANPDMIRTVYAASTKSQPLIDDVGRFAYQLTGAFFLTQAWAIKSSEDFKNLEDQRGVFKAHLVLIMLGFITMSAHVITGKITLEDSFPTIAIRLFFAVNSVLAIRHSNSLSIELIGSGRTTKKIS